MKALLLVPGLLACGPTLEQRELARTAATFASEVDPELRKIYAAQVQECFDVYSAQLAECLTHRRDQWRKVRAGLGTVRDAWCRAEPEKCEAPK